MARGRINPRTVMAPAAAFTMACVLFLYTRSSIRRARMDAKNSREAERQAHQQQQQQWEERRE